MDDQNSVNHALIECVTDINRIVNSSKLLLGENPFPEVNKQTPKIISDIYLPHIRSIEKSLGELVEKLQPRISEPEIEKLLISLDKFNEKIESLVARFGLQGPLQARSIAVGLVTLVENCTAKLPKETRRNIQNHAREVNRITAWHEIDRVSILLTNVDKKLSEFSSVNSYSSPHPLPPNYAGSVYDLILLVWDELKPQTQQLGIKFHERFRCLKDVHFEIDREGLYKAIRNLIANAIKYTGHLPNDTNYGETWIKVFGEVDEYYFTIGVESWGVPLTHDEAKTDVLFARNYRGRFAKFTDRKGSGLGLFEVQQFILKNYGKVEIDSDSVDPEDINPPFKKTTFIVRLPPAQG